MTFVASVISVHLCVHLCEYAWAYEHARSQKGRGVCTIVWVCMSVWARTQPRRQGCVYTCVSMHERMSTHAAKKAGVCVHLCEYAWAYEHARSQKGRGARCLPGAPSSISLVGAKRNTVQPNKWLHHTPPEAVMWSYLAGPWANTPHEFDCSQAVVGDKHTVRVYVHVCRRVHEFRGFGC